ncbi:MAG: DUF4417 domain-containing protein [Schwartzia sp.]|nr:DUF4417 domain-containing protein [Schwartzia sp. (in: firmicutes)]
MRVVEKKLSALRPYRYNPRKNDQAVPAVAESIRLFGFRVPLVIGKSGEIVCGHTRFKAAKELGLASVPCVIADDLTPEQIRAFRLADNRVAELAEWDFDLLSGEMEGLADMGVSLDGLGFDFSFDDPGLGIEVPASNDNPGDSGELTPKPPEEIKSEGRLLHLEIFNPAGAGAYGIPEILPEEWEPLPLAPFSDAASFKDNPASFGLHFFLDDYRFERVWNNPRQYLPQIEKFAFALSPDFSLYLDTPKAVQIWNHYRKHWCAAY